MPMSVTETTIPTLSPAGPHAAAAHAAYPPGALHANSFNLFNALSWQITTGAPAILYAQSQGASSFILGLISAFMPLLAIFQLPAAHLLPKYGYRRFILAGWGSRTLCIFAIAGVPLLYAASPGLRLGLLVFFLFAFNLLRGLASGAWWPWMAELIPAPMRGWFLSRDQAFTQIGSILAFELAAFALMGKGPAAPWQFSVVFLISAIGATISLLFIRLVPDVTAPEKLNRSGHRVPWGAMLLYPPFFRLMVFNVMYYLMMGGLQAFTVEFLKSAAHYSDDLILHLTSLGFVGALFTVRPVGRMADRHGSKPLLYVFVLVYVLILVGWWLVSARLVGGGLWIIALLNLGYGIGYVNWNVANNRLMMATMPVMGRNHFFALFIVITSLVWGLAPILWGILLDAIGPRHFATGPVLWNQYSIYFALAMLLAVGTMMCTACLHERSGHDCGRVSLDERHPTT
jgi:MFS family permease